MVHALRNDLVGARCDRLRVHIEGHVDVRRRHGGFADDLAARRHLDSQVDAVRGPRRLVVGHGLDADFGVGDDGGTPVLNAVLTVSEKPAASSNLERRRKLLGEGQRRLLLNVACRLPSSARPGSMGEVVHDGAGARVELDAG